jgi:hypothetical protein
MDEQHVLRLVRLRLRQRGFRDIVLNGERVVIGYHGPHTVGVIVSDNTRLNDEQLSIRIATRLEHAVRYCREQQEPVHVERVDDETADEVDVDGVFLP